MSDFDDAERQIWAGRAEAFRDSFAKLCAHTVPALLDAAGAGPGTRLLDVGTGSGTVAAAACARGARVSAVDAEPGMAALARRAAPDADVSVAILPDLPFAAGTFDAVVANFVINHVGRPAQAVAALRAVTRPGGHVAVTIWCRPAGAGHELLDRAASEAGVQRPAGLPQLAPVDGFPHNAEGLTCLLSGAGFGEVTCQQLDWDHIAPRSSGGAAPQRESGSSARPSAGRPRRRSAGSRPPMTGSCRSTQAQTGSWCCATTRCSRPAAPDFSAA